MSREQKNLRNKDQERNNPCLNEHKLSLKCLDANSYNHEKCEVFFQNYRNCKEFWTKVQKDRRRAGILPELPDPEERVRIKQEHMSSKPKVN